MNASQENDKIIDTGDIEPPKGWKSSWEMQSFIFVLRAVGILLFLGYLFATVGPALIWGKLKWIRSQPLEHALPMAESRIKDGQPEKIADWASYRLASERPRIIEILEPLTSEMDSSQFLLYSGWAAKAGDMEKSLFWYQYARYRLRYDALRCGSPTAVDDVKGLLELNPRTDIEALLREKPALLAKSIEDTLKYDAIHPADNDPLLLCSMLNKLNQANYAPLTRDKWADNRYLLRMMTEASLKKMKAAKSPAKKAKEKK